MVQVSDLTNSMAPTVQSEYVSPTGANGTYGTSVSIRYRQNSGGLFVIPLENKFVMIFEIIPNFT
jgi:hypothetical protein